MKIIYIHFGSIPEYLKKSINKAIETNQVVLITNDLSYKNNLIQIENVANYLEDLEDFKLTYKHFSYLDINFEFICILRWFVLNRYAQKNNIPYFYYSDSDVMIYYNLEEYYNKYYSKYDASYVTTENQKNYRWSSSACCSFWKKESIDKFCTFIKQIYSKENIKLLEEKWNFHQQNNKPGGVCDMTLLYLFQKEINFYPLSKVIEDFCFDQNMKDENNYFDKEYEFKGNLKNIIFKNGKPYCNNIIYNKEIKFLTLVEYAKLI